MKNGSGKKNFFLVTLLALVCICTVELIVCRFYDPTLYHSITDPVVTAVTNTVSTASHTITATANAVKSEFNAMIQKLEDRRAARELERARLEAAQAAPPEEVSSSSADLLTDTQIVTAPLILSSSSLCDPAVTQLQTLHDEQILTGGMIDVVYYNQSDPLWGDLKYGSDKISSHGCGPTTMAMVVDSLSDTDTDPLMMAQWAVSHGHWARHGGSYHSIVLGTAEGFGLDAESFPSRDIVALQDALLSGKLLVALMGPGHFTQSGHFIVLRGVTLSGEILVADPSSLERSLTAWDAQLIFDELSKSTSNGGPLWVISVPEQPICE